MKAAPIHRCALYLPLSVLWVLAMTGCGGGGSEEAIPDLAADNLVPEFYDDRTVFREILSTEVISSEGGTIEVTDAGSPLYGVKIVIPPAALPANHTITLSEVDNPPALPAGMNYIGMPLDLSPDGLSFQKDITITLPYTDTELHDAGASDDAAPPTPRITSATITPSSGTECTIALMEIGVTHNYGLEYVASVTYKAENGYTNPTLDINDQGKLGDRVAGDAIYSVEGNAGTGVGKATARIDFTLTDLYGKTDTASTTYTFTGSCEKSKGVDTSAP